MRTGLDRLDDAGIAERLDIAQALQPLLLGIHRERHVDREHELEIDSGLGLGGGNHGKPDQQGDGGMDEARDNTHGRSLP